MTDLKLKKLQKKYDACIYAHDNAMNRRDALNAAYKASAYDDAIKSYSAYRWALKRVNEYKKKRQGAT